MLLKLQTPLPVLRLCDLTDAATRAGVGVDSATLYAPDLCLPQAWAECLARHPARLDGIVYRSRHTDEPCLVVWKRPGRRSAVEGLRFIEAGPFADSEAARRLAHRMGMRLAFLR